MVSEGFVFTVGNVSPAWPLPSTPLNPSPPKEQPPSSPTSHRAHALASSRTVERYTSRAPGAPSSVDLNLRRCLGEGRDSARSPRGFSARILCSLWEEVGVASGEGLRPGRFYVPSSLCELNLMLSKIPRFSKFE